MPRISTIYDKIVNEEDGIEYSRKVFMVRGDEAYAKSTDVELEVGSPSYAQTDFTVSVTVTVHRGTGSSVCHVYDNDELIGQFNTSTAINSHTFSFDLPYDVEHNLKAIFRGNSECLGSKSRVEKLYVETLPVFQTGIDFTGTSTFITSDADRYTIRIALDIDGDTTSENLYNKPIYVTHPHMSRDGVTYTTDIFYTGEDNNYVDREIVMPTINEFPDGVYTISAVVPRSEGLNPTEDSITLMKGYQVTITDYPSAFIYGETNNVTVSVIDYNNNPVSDVTVTFDNYSATTDSEGIAVIPVIYITSGTYHATCEGSVSDDITISVINAVTNLTITPTSAEVVRGDGGVTFSIYAEGENGQGVPNLPIFIQSESVTGTFNTDSAGHIYLDYEYSYDQYIYVRYGNLSTSARLVGWWNIWDSNGIRNTSDVKLPSSVQKYPNYWYGTITPTDYIQFLDEDMHYSVEMDVISFQKGSSTQLVFDGIPIPYHDFPRAGFKLKFELDEYSPTMFRVYVDGVLIYEIGKIEVIGEDYPRRLTCDSGVFTMAFTNVKIKEL